MGYYTACRTENYPKYSWGSRRKINTDCRWANITAQEIIGQTQ